MDGTPADQGPGPGGRLSDEGDFSIARIPADAAPTREGPRVNREINVRNVRLVDAAGEMVGIVSIRDALLAAEDAGLDLVEIAPNADPPVCKILDYGKFKYEAQKKAAEARKKQKIIEVKELKLRPNIDDNDYEVKMRAARRFLEEGDKVKFTMRFRGREMAHQDIGMKVLVRVRDELDEIAKVEQMPKLEGRQMIMVMAPR
ncbi:MAG TPA: translation initiation factor IF-3 [Azospirillaceae bacterium]|nr:translation initiation factor IF-3 [Azospirillaceae bacterium]